MKPQQNVALLIPCLQRTVKPTWRSRWMARISDRPLWVGGQLNGHSANTAFPDGGLPADLAADMWG
jgi:hypothetical protein